MSTNSNKAKQLLLAAVRTSQLGASCTFGAQSVLVLLLLSVLLSYSAGYMSYGLSNTQQDTTDDMKSYLQVVSTLLLGLTVRVDALERSAHVAPPQNMPQPDRPVPHSYVFQTSHTIGDIKVDQTHAVDHVYDQRVACLYGALTDWFVNNMCTLYVGMGSQLLDNLYLPNNYMHVLEYTNVANYNVTDPQELERTQPPTGSRASSHSDCHRAGNSVQSAPCFLRVSAGDR